MEFIVLIGRMLFVTIFLLAAPNHFTQGAINYAASQGVPLAAIAVPLSGIIALLGAVSVALGFKAKWGAWLLVLFLVPVSLMMHNFWAVSDPAAAKIQQIMFMKNLSMLGAALCLSHFGAGRLSIDAWLSGKK